MMGARDFVSRRPAGMTAQTKRRAVLSSCRRVIARLEWLDRIHGRKIDDANPEAACTPVAIVLDNGPVHTSKATRETLAARKHWPAPEWQAK